MNGRRPTHPGDRQAADAAAPRCRRDRGLGRAGLVDRDHLHASAVHHVAPRAVARRPRAEIGGERPIRRGRAGRRRRLGELVADGVRRRPVVTPKPARGAAVITVNPIIATSIATTPLPGGKRSPRVRSWLAGTPSREIRAGRVNCDGGVSSRPILNDCCSPTASRGDERYCSQAGGRARGASAQRVWISTAAGSKGGIRKRRRGAAADAHRGDAGQGAREVPGEADGAVAG